MIPWGWAVGGGLVLFWIGFMVCAWCTIGREDELMSALEWLLLQPQKKAAWDNARAVLMKR